MLSGLALVDGPMGEAPTGLWATRRARWVVLVFVWLVSAVWVGHYLDHGWLALDEGIIGQSAERVLLGDRPHEDFDDVYTGGLSYLNAAAMATFGMDLRSPRIVLAAAFLLCIPVFYYAASRFAGPLGAGLATLLAVAWGPSVHMVALPSWYNLIFAIAGLAACLRFIDTEHRRWLFVAGLCAGLSFLFKLVGLYLLASVLLFVWYIEAGRASTALVHDEADGVGLFTVLGLPVALVVAVLVARLLLRSADHTTLVYLLVPVLAVVALPVATGWSRSPPGLERQRIRALIWHAWPVVLGFAIPIVLFLIPYVIAGSLEAFLNGVFVLPLRRFDGAAQSFPSVLGSLPLFLVLVAVTFMARLDARERWIAIFALAAAILAVVFSSRASWQAYRLIWGTVRLAPCVLVVIGAGLLYRNRRRSAERRMSRLYLVLSILAMTALIQFPYSTASYFVYIGPTVALTALAVFATLDYPSRAVPAVLGAAYVAFGAWVLTPPSTDMMGVEYRADIQTVALGLPRASIRGTLSGARDYRAVTRLVQSHARGGYLYATPDAPKVYFLTGQRNPTRTLYEMFGDSAGRTSRILATLDQRAVTAIVINTRPEFSGALSSDLRQALERRYPVDSVVGRFDVRWQR